MSNMDLEQAKQVLSEHYETIILANSNIADCKIIHKGCSLQDLDTVRVHMSVRNGVHINAKQVYTPTKAMMQANVPATKKTSQLLGKPFLEEKKSAPKVKKRDPNKWQCECGEINEYSDSNERKKRETIQYQCGICRQWTGQKPLSAEVV